MSDSAAGDSSKHTGSQRAMRERNLDMLVEALRIDGPQTQVELARHTGLSRGTVSNLVKTLLAEEIVTTQDTTYSGRKAKQISLLPDKRALIGIDVGRTHLAVGLADAFGNILALKESKLAPGHLAEATMSVALEMAKDLLQQSDRDVSAVAQAVLSLPASFDTQEYRIIQGAIFSSWANRNLAELAGKIFPFPVQLANDADMGAFAQSRLPQMKDFSTILYVKLGSGIGAGLLHDGQVFRSSTGISGEIGHTRVLENGLLCACGNYGCLETIASVPVLLDRYERTSAKKNVSVESFVQSAKAGDPIANRILVEAGEAIGRALSVAVNLLGPDAVVIGGPLSPVGESLLEGVSGATKRRAIPSIAWNTNFLVSSLLTNTEVVGACAWAADQVNSSTN